MTFVKVDEENKFSDKQLAKIKEIIKEKWFSELNEEIVFCDLSYDENEVIEQIKRYILIYLHPYDYNASFNELADGLILFLEKYSRKESPEFKKIEQDSKKGWINIIGSLVPNVNGYHIDGKFRLRKNANVGGRFTMGFHISTNGKKYLEKADMNRRGVSGASDESRKELKYNAMVAQHIFELFGEPTAKYMLINNKYFASIITENFLEENQELHEFYELYNNDVSNNNDLNTYSQRINMLISNITMRYGKKLKTEDLNRLINKLKLQYYKQEFIKRMIGPMDSNLGNTAIIVTTDGESEIPKDIDISPAYDLDLSFCAADDVNSCKGIKLMECDNGKTDIMSLMEECKNIEGFYEFIKKVTDIIKQPDIEEKIMFDAYKEHELEFFKSSKERYKLFLQQRFTEVLEAYKQIYEKNIEVDENEFILE